MHFAVPQDAAPASRPADRADTSAHASSAAKQKTSTTALLLAMALVAIATKAPAITRPAPASGSATAQNAGAIPDKVIAPEFCKDQTWPYLDSRCLRRVDNPAAPAAEPRVITPPANTTATAPATNDATANDATANNMAAQSASRETTAAADQDQSAPATAMPSSAETQAPAGEQAGQQVMQSVFPTTAPGAASESGAQRTDATPYQRDVSQHPRYQHWNRHSGFFGFRF